MKATPARLTHSPFRLLPGYKKGRACIGSHGTDHQHLFRPQPQTGYRRVHHQREIRMDECLFTARFAPCGAKAAKTVSTGSVTCASASVNCGSWGLNTPATSPNGRRVGAAMEVMRGSLIRSRSKCPPTRPVAPVSNIRCISSPLQMNPSCNTRPLNQGLLFW